jgi:RND family efflux transporter MFP subunit
MSTRACVAASLVFLLACNRKAGEAPPRPTTTVRAMVVQSGAQAPLKLRGTIQAGSRLHLGFKLSGVISAVLVKEGEKVRKDQLLARLDQSDAMGQLRVAGANRMKAAQDWKRADTLVKSGALPAKARDDARTALEAADATLAAASENFKRSQIRAPVDGKVVQRKAQPGESIAAGSPVLVLDETDNPVIKVGVTDADLKRLRLGQSASLQLEDGSPPLPGSVSSLAAAPNSADGLYSVEIRPETQKLQSGSLVTVSFEDVKAEATLRIPLEAKVRRQDKDSVFIVEGDKDKAVARLRPIETGRSEGWQVIVRSGLKDGERIVAEGAYFLQDGQPIRILN